MGGAPGGDMGGMGGAPGGEAGGAPISAPGGGAPMAQNLTSISASNQINPAAYGGKILKEKTRQKMDASQQKLYKQVEKQRDSQFGTGTRDEKGRIVFTKCERQLLDKIGEYKKNGLITYPVIAQYPVRFGSTEYPIDFALPNLKIGIEADGETFHSSPKQMAHDKERDMKLAQAGWTILRFKDTEIEEKGERVMSAIVKTIMQKEAALGKLNSQDPQNK
jgi:very-short-patch-repair endonuclease